MPSKNCNNVKKYIYIHIKNAMLNPTYIIPNSENNLDICPINALLEWQK